MSNESITITQSINSVTVAAVGSVGLNAGGLIQGNLEVDGNVVIDGLLTVGADTDGKDVRFWGETASKYTLWDASQDKLIITGDLQVDGTTTTINSTVVTIEDPVFTLGGATAPTTSDSKDRGIEFHYYDTDASAGKKGFFGWGNSDNAIKFLLNCADPSGSEIFTGDLAEVHTGLLIAKGGDSGGGINAATVLQAENDDHANVVISTPSTKVGRFGFGDSNSLKAFTAYDHASDAMFFQVNSATAMTIDSAQNVGIGTASPDSLLHLEGTNPELTIMPTGNSGTSYIQFYRTTGAGAEIEAGKIEGSAAAFRFSTTDGANSPLMEFVTTGTSGGHFDFKPDGTQAMRIAADGKVGIGTTSLTREFEVYGATNAGQILRAGNGYSELYFADDEALSGWLSYGHSTNSLVFATTGTERMQIDGSGNVGIGTASPSALLQVGDSATGGNNVLKIAGAKDPGQEVALQFYTGTNSRDWRIKVDASSATFAIRDEQDSLDRLVIDGDGNVGIGTASPGAVLDVILGTTGQVRLGRSSSQYIKITGDAAADTIQNTTSKPFRIASGSGQILSLGSAGVADRMVIDTSGRVGIGTTSPSSTLTISGADDKDTGPNIVLLGDAANQVESGRIRFQEGGSYQGGYVHYNGYTNKFSLGVHEASDSVTSSDRNILTIDRTTGTIEMDRGTTELPFFDYKATTAGDADSSISTLTTSGATTHHIQVDINGAKAWIAVSTNNPS